MRAACYRRLEQTDRWSAILQAVRDRVGSAQRWQQEIRLGLIQTGQAIESGEAQLVSLLDAGLPPHDVVPSFVLGYPARTTTNEPKRCWMPGRLMIRSPRTPRTCGASSTASGLSDPRPWNNSAAPAQQPRHELAGIGIAELLEEQDHLEDALAAYVQLSRLHPWGERAKVGRTRVLRGLARVDEARRVLEPLAEVPDCSREVARGMARWNSRRPGFHRPRDGLPKQNSTKPPMSTHWPLRPQRSRSPGTGRRPNAGSRRHAVRNRNTRLPDVRVRVVMDPRDQQAAGELRRLSQSPLAASGPRDTPAPQPGDMPDSRAARFRAKPCTRNTAPLATARWAMAAAWRLSTCFRGLATFGTNGFGL